MRAWLHRPTRRHAAGLLCSRAFAPRHLWGPASSDAADAPAPRTPQQARAAADGSTDENSWMEGGSARTAAHLRAEDAYARAALQRMGVPALQQQLLREMQARLQLPGPQGAEASGQQVARAASGVGGPCTAGTHAAGRAAAPPAGPALAQPPPHARSDPCPCCAEAEPLSNSLDPPPERIGPWLYTHTRQHGGALVRRPAHGLPHAAHGGSSSVQGRGGRAGAAGDEEEVEVVVDGGVLRSAQEHAARAAGIRVEAAVRDVKLSRCQRFVALTLPLAAEQQAEPAGSDPHACCVVREISTGAITRLLRRVCGVEFSADGTALLATLPGAQGRPSEVRMYPLSEPHGGAGGSATDGTLLLREPDPAFYLTVGRTKDWAFNTINANAKQSSEVHLLDAWQPWRSPLRCVQPRAPGLEYFVEHHAATGHLYVLTNLGHDSSADAGSSSSASSSSSSSSSSASSQPDHGGAGGLPVGVPTPVPHAPAVQPAPPRPIPLAPGLRLMRVPCCLGSWEARHWQPVPAADSCSAGAGAGAGMGSAPIIVDMDMFSHWLVVHGRTQQGLPCAWVLPLGGEQGGAGGGCGAAHACCHHLPQQGQQEAAQAQPQQARQGWAGAAGGEGARARTHAGLVPLPAWALHVVPGANADPHSPSLRLAVSSPVHPPHTLDFCVACGTLRVAHVERARAWLPPTPVPAPSPAPGLAPVEQQQQQQQQQQQEQNHAAAGLGRARSWARAGARAWAWLVGGSRVVEAAQGSGSSSSSCWADTSGPLAEHDPWHYTIQRLCARSHDGALIPITVVHHLHHHHLHQAHMMLHHHHHHHHHLPQQQRHHQGHHSASSPAHAAPPQPPPQQPPPLVLRAYGAYGTPLDPGFDAADLSLLERGFVVAYAHVRGGGELGRPWHAAGRQLCKANSLHDYHACLGALHAAGYAHPGRVAGLAFSAGALLLGSAVASGAALASLAPVAQAQLWPPQPQPPQPSSPHQQSAAASAAPAAGAARGLLGAAVLRAPLLDLQAVMADPGLPLTVHEYDEWGDPRTPGAARAIQRVCPYAALGVALEGAGGAGLPGVLVTCALDDARVPAWVPAKWAARARRLQDLAAHRTGRQQPPVLLRVQREGGHEAWCSEEGAAEEYAFVVAALSGSPAGEG